MRNQSSRFFFLFFFLFVFKFSAPHIFKLREISPLALPQQAQLVETEGEVLTPIHQGQGLTGEDSWGQGIGWIEMSYLTMGIYSRNSFLLIHSFIIETESQNSSQSSCLSLPTSAGITGRNQHTCFPWCFQMLHFGDGMGVRRASGKPDTRITEKQSAAISPFSPFNR